MMTRYLTINPEHPEPEAITEAAAVIRSGGTVAFPTETVYGLGANGLDPAAVERIFIAKGRPRRNPLILHVSAIEQARRLAATWPPEAECLAARFWPGPLTLILPRPQAGARRRGTRFSGSGARRAPGISPVPAGYLTAPAQTADAPGALLLAPDIVTAGLPSVALRMPSHPVALALIGESGLPIAAPSANASGRPSPTLAEHVRADLDGRIDLVLDGGATVVGVESTILDLTGEQPVLLRPGGVTREQLQRVLGTVLVHGAAMPGTDAVIAGVIPAGQVDPQGSAADADALSGIGAAPCPGTMFRHYAPRAKAMVVTGNAREQEAKIRNYLAAHPDQRVAILATAENAPVYLKLKGAASSKETGRAPIHVEVIGSRSRPREIAGRIFSSLRNCDQAGAEVILIEAIPLRGMGLAVMNRLYRAAANRAI